jgi:hypothetical protein
MEATATPRTVRIYRRDRTWVIDSGGRTRPEMRSLLTYLPEGTRTTARSCSSIEDGLSMGINPQLLSGALSAWYTEHPNAPGTTGALEVTVPEGISELPDNTAYLALGDFIYRMVPVRQARTGKALITMRAKMQREIEALRVSLREQAGRESEQLIAQAQQRAAIIRAEAEQVRLAIASDNALRFPSWLQNIPVKSYDGRQWAMRPVAITFQWVSHGLLRWPTKTLTETLEGRTVRLQLWLPLDGTPERVSLVDTRDGFLPHIIVGACCVKLGEPVQAITSLERLDKFGQQISRAMSTINLASLLSPNVVSWNPQVVRLLPDAIKAWLETHRDNVSQRTGEGLPPVAPEHQEGGTETWSVR